MIQITHDDAGKFIAELTIDSTRVHAGVIRMISHVEEINDGLNRVTLKAGYMVKLQDGDYELRELLLYAGEDLANGHDLEGTHNCEELCAALAEDIMQLGLEIRGGEYS